VCILQTKKSLHFVKQIMNLLYSCENSIITKLRNKMPPQSNSNTPTATRMVNQEYSPALNSSACNVMVCSELSSVMNADDSNSSSSFLRIQSPTARNSNNIMNQHKSNANVSNFVDAYESLHKQNNSVSSNPVSFDSLFQHNLTVILYFVLIKYEAYFNT
jgi:hypothetical protein